MIRTPIAITMAIITTVTAVMSTAMSIIVQETDQFSDMNIILDLFLTFEKVGLLTFGGGYTMIALIENTFVEKKQLISHDKVLNKTFVHITESLGYDVESTYVKRESRII